MFFMQHWNSLFAGFEYEVEARRTDKRLEAEHLLEPGVRVKYLLFEVDSQIHRQKGDAKRGEID